MGPNGAGKTTLLRVLLGQLTPSQGSVRLGTNLQIAYFDQLRAQLDEDKTVQENVGDGYDTVQVGGQPQHVLGYLQDFLFSPERARTPIRYLSGGERNRVLLAKLFAKPANIVVLDEPTNDLDTETLELLEELLVAYQGTVLLVSHDRAFLNNVVTSTIVFEGGGVREYVGGYDDWLRQRPPVAPRSSGETASSSPRRQDSPSATSAVAAAGRPRRRLAKFACLTKNSRNSPRCRRSWNSWKPKSASCIKRCRPPSSTSGPALRSPATQPCCSNWRSNWPPPSSGGKPWRSDQS